MDVQTQEVWQGPTQVPTGMLVVASARAWERVRATWNEAVRARADAHPDWRREVVVVLAGAQTGELTIVLRIARFERTGDALAIDVEAKSTAAAATATVPSAMNNPTLIVTAPADAFNGDPTATLSWNGKELKAPVRYER
jgi:hypothetical protein